MNRTLLLENLPDLLEDLDARLTALEAAEPQAQPVKISYVEHLADEVKRLTALENNKPNESDWEAAANSALAQLTFSRKNVNWLRDTLDAAQDKIERLKTELDDLTAAATGLADDVIRLTAERNALAAQLDDLRNVNAGLRKSNASQQALLVSGRLRSLRRIEAIFAVEWVTGECPWCGNSHREGHADDCQRQAALR